MTRDDQVAVFVSALLGDRNPEVEASLRTTLAGRLRLIPRTKDIWCRDYMPVQIGPGRFVQFRYYPDYLKGYPQLRTEDAAGLIGLAGTVKSNLVIDGGNVVRHLGTAILTDKIYAENPKIVPMRLEQRLRELLEVDRLIVIPQEPGDVIGHADGMLRFVNSNVLMVNDYRRANPEFGKRLTDSLAGFELIPFPYAPTGEVIDGIDSAVGVYINYLHAGDAIACPTWDKAEDDAALRALERAFPRSRIAAIRCERLAKKWRGPELRHLGHDDVNDHVRSISIVRSFAGRKLRERSGFVLRVIAASRGCRRNGGKRASGTLFRCKRPT